ncbi:L,D-transpeptidase family protein [Blautia massiliensis (ex Durand et al. 2017)]|uniref:L,D-transpeptidase family protein n=1 Tax=Blautia massiliensis (ex Durand et al. 2017) TaxID=1737424 RepID=UPI0022E3C26F|nr:L,D-transpeptidase family protein [uncultured Blautia sp.]
MKRRVVAIFLSLTLCMGGTLEAGAAALGSTDVQMAAETAGDPAEDVFSDEEGTTVQQPKTEADQTGSTDSSEETPAEPENPAETPDVIETPEITETPETTETPEVTEAPDATPEDSTDPGDDFSAGDARELDAPATDTAVQNKVENNKAEETFATGASLVNGVVVAKTSDWVSANGFYRLRKKKVAASAAPEGKASEDPAESSEEEQKTVDETSVAAQEVQQTEALQDGAAESEQAQAIQNESAEGEQETAAEEGAAEEVSTEEVSAAEASTETASTETAPAETEAAAETSESVDNAETLAMDEGNASLASETGSIEDNYFTAQDGLLKIDTNGHVGYYLFNEDGYLVTGRMTREPGAAGYTGTQKTEWYFLESSKASLYSDSTGKAITPWTSNLGQQKRNYWLWTGTIFRYYNSQGDYKSIEAQNLAGKIKKIGNAYYTLMRNGKPRTGILKLTTGSTTYQYYFQPASKEGEIPGKLFYGGWTYVLNSKNQKRFIYCSPKAATRGQIMKHGVYVSPVMSKKYRYMLNASGYVMTNTMAKAQNNAYYVTDSKGRIITKKLVKYKGSRYYFGDNGKRVSWKNCWHGCPGASNKIYYFGGTAGKVVEKYGWQKVTDAKGQFFGWFYFDKNGNHYKSQMITNKSSKKSYYFNSTGQLATGKTKIGKKYYFFATSDANAHRGWMYKSTLIRYQNKWYYAGGNGVLKKSGWQKVGKYWYYLQNYTVVTNKSMKRGSVNGYLDSQGRFSTGWVIVSDYYDQVKYIDPNSGSKYLTNTSRWINGKLYYFDKNGYRRNDVSNIYGGPYYLEVDKTNGVMTVYTNSSKTIPVKTIRVSVGLSGTPTWDGTYRLSRSLRWQPLMGPSWGQYGTHVDGCGQGGIFIHSVAGSTRSVYNLPAGEYLKLGQPASHGCIRTCVADAKWVYENCNGSTIHIYSSGNYVNNESFKGPLGRRPLATFRGAGNFDPTDPEVP